MADNLDVLYGKDWFDNIERTIGLLDKQEQSIKATNDALKGLTSDLKGAKSLEDLATGQTKVAAATQQAVAGFDDFNAAIKQAEALKAQYNGSTKEIVNLTLTSAKATKELANAARIQQANVAKSISSAAAEKKAIKDLTDERALLVKALKDEEVRYANLYLTQGKANKLTEEAKQRVLQLRGTLDGLNQSIGRYGDNVGNYAGKFNNLGFSIRNIAGELPNAGISFRTFIQSISNNIGPLSDAIRQVRVENAALAAEGKPVVSVGKQIIGTLFSWQTALLGLVALFTAFGPKIVDYIFNTDKAKKAAEAAKKEIEALAAAQKELTDAQAQSVGHMKSLYTITQDVTLSQKARTDAVKELQKEYPAYFANMTQEEILAGKATQTYLDLTDALIAKARAQVYQSRYNELLSKEIDLSEKINDKIRARNALGVTGGLTKDVNGKETFTFDKSGNEDKAVALGYELKELEAERAENARKMNGYMEQVNKNTVTELGLKKEVQKVEKATPSKDLTKDREREEERLAREHFQKLQSQAEEDAAIQKAILENEKESYRDRLVANSTYTYYAVLAAQYRGAKEHQTEEEVQKAITQVLLGEIKRREEIQDDATKKAIKQAKFEKDNLAAAGGVGGPSETQAEGEARIYAKRRQMADDSFQFASSLADLNSAFTQRRIDEIDSEIEAINKRRDAEIAAINASTLTEEQKKARIAQATAQTQVKEDQLNEKRRQELRRDAQIHKYVTLAKIAVETALAVVHQLGSGDPYTAFGRAIAVGALGAAEFAAAAATPIPGFKKGTDNSPEGFAKVGEEGVELGLTKEGKVFLTPDKETVTYLQAGTKIVPHTETIELIKYMGLGLPQARQRDNTGELLDGLKENAAYIADAIRGKKFPKQSAMPAWYSAYHQKNNR